MYTLTCINCRTEFDEKETTTLCQKCNYPLDIIYDFGNLKKRINNYILLKTPPKVIKYISLLPLNDYHSPITLEEGGTPLHLAKNLGYSLNLTNLFVKAEGLNPTGAFKDRGSFVEINKSRELGYKAVVVASTGNMAASVAAFSIQANLPCYVFVPQNTPRGKLAQCLSYNANVIAVRGTYADAFNIASETAQKYGFYLAGDYVFRLEGQKTLAYELVEQTYLKRIDYIIVPVGMGTNISAIWKGFKEYHQLGFLKKLPKLIAVQSKGADPIVHAFNKKNPKITPVSKPNTICSAIAVGNPIDAPRVLIALKESKGMAVAVSDMETLQAQQQLARQEGIYVEPSSATVIAAVNRLSKNGIFKSDDRIICVTTGSGLKDPAVTLKNLAEPPVIEPIIKEVDRVINGKLFNIRTFAALDKEKILFKEKPSLNQLTAVVKEEMNIGLEDIDKTILKREIEEFYERGKLITKADLQAIIETAIQQKPNKKILEVIDYHITTTRHKKAEAKIVIKLENKLYKAQAEGVGPVDAAINALRKALKTNSYFNFQLLDYNVEVVSSGTDASVVVSIIMKDNKDNQIIVRQTSPDILLASIEAFERGYNELANY